MATLIQLYQDRKSKNFPYMKGTPTNRYCGLSLEYPFNDFFTVYTITHCAKSRAELPDDQHTVDLLFLEAWLT